MRKISGIRELIPALGGHVKFGKLLFPGTAQPDARAMDLERRGYIPAHHWPKVREAARLAGVEVTDRQLSGWRTRAKKATSEARHDEGNQRLRALTVPKT